MAHPISVAIIGAGVTGLQLARQLSSHAAVQVFEKSRGFGGRMSTRRAETFQFDHGAQYFTAHGEDFQTFLAPFIADGYVAPWAPRLTRLGFEAPDAPVWNAPRYVAVPGMNALAKAMAGGLEVHRATRVASIDRQAKGWRITTTDGAEEGPFDWVISTAPAEQSIALMPDCFAERHALEDAKMQGCYSLMIGFSALPDPRWDAAVVENSPLAWMALNHTKPGRGPGASLLCQSDNDWAEAHLEDDQDSVRDILASEVQRLTGFDAGAAAYLSLHRWRFAKVEKAAGKPFLMDAENGLAAAGDWCGAGRVEAGFDSASALAEILLEVWN